MLDCSCVTHSPDQDDEVFSSEAGLDLYRNTVLRHLSAETIRRLRLVHAHLPLKQSLEGSGRAIDQLLFIESGVGSMISNFEDGSEVEVGLFGHESVVGVSALMGVRRSLNRIYMRVPGAGYACSLDDAQAEFSLGGEFQNLALRYVQMRLTQATQTAACIAKHDLGQRLARWLLLTSDRAGTTELAFSQHALAITLGVRRTSVAVAMGRLKQGGVLDYTHGRIRLLDIPSLEVQACECYHVLKLHLNNYLELDTGFLI